MPTVYIETTIPSYYYETRTSAEAIAWRRATRNWWDQERHHYDLVTSDVVLGELRSAPEFKAAPGTLLLSHVRVLEPDARVAEAASTYMKHRLVPARAVADAFHLAFASVFGIDYLLTWNCKHLANVRKVPHITTINRRLGLSIPVITTPLTLLDENAE